MARKRKRDETPTGTINLAQRDVQKAFSRALISDATILGIVRRNCEAIEKCNGIRALDGVELQHLEAMTQRIEAAERTLLKLGRRLERRARG